MLHNLVTRVNVARKEEKAKSACYFCSVPCTEETTYEIRQLRPMETFLNINPQWLSFGKAFDANTKLCNRGYCLAAAFENWRLDSFGVKSPRSPRMAGNSNSPKKAPKATPARPAHLSELEHEESFLQVAGADLNDQLSLAEATSAVAASAAASTNGNGEMLLRSTSVDNSEFYKSIEERRRLVARLIDKNTGAAAAMELLNNSKSTVVASNTDITSASTLIQGTMAEHADLTVKTNNNRDERLRVARRLQELRDKQPELEYKRQEKLKESIVERKRELYERIIEARIEHTKAEEKLKRYDIEQKLSLMKLDVYSQAKSESVSASEQEKQKKLFENIEPTLSHLQHVPEAKNIIDKGLKIAVEDKEYEKQSTAITQELQHALREAFTKNKEDLLEERRKLTADRFALEARMGQLKGLDGLDDKNEGDIDENEHEKDSNPNDSDSGYDPEDQLENDYVNAREDDQPFDSAYAFAERMDAIVHRNMSTLTKRILTNVDEKDWLTDQPSTVVWKELLRRVDTFKNTEILNRENINRGLISFLEMESVNRKLLADEKKIRLHNIAVMNIANAIIAEVFNDWLNGYLNKFLSISKQCSDILDTAVLDVLCGSSATQKAFLKATGREFLLLGTIKDMRKQSYHKHCSNQGLPVAEYNVKVSQSNCINSNYHRDSGMNYAPSQHIAAQKDTWPCVTDKDISLFAHTDNELCVDDFIRRTPVMRAEQIHWSKSALQNCRASPLVLPNITGRIELLRIFPRTYTNSSLLIAAVHIGIFGAWSVPWTGATPLLLCVSPPLERKNRCDIIDIREGSFSSNTIICLYKNGHIRVWDLNPVSILGRRKAGSHLHSMFPENLARYVPVIPSCIYHLNPLDLSMPLELDESGRPLSTEEAIKKALDKKVQGENKKTKASKIINKHNSDAFAGGAVLGKTAAADYQHEEGLVWGTKKSKVLPQPGTHPVVACFHPSFTITGRNPSILIGSDGGNIMKFNIDYRIDDLDAPILYLPPFTDVEYVHPQNAPDLILAAGKTRKGNRVYRELFHFHRSAVIFIGIVNKISDKIVSVDEGGHIAIWQYTKPNFKGMCWYEPIQTGLLNVDWKSFSFMAKSNEDEQQPTSTQLSQLKCRTRSLITLSQLVQGAKTDVTYIQEVYYPVLASTSLYYIEFTALLSKERKINVRREAEVGLRASANTDDESPDADRSIPVCPWIKIQPPIDTKWSSVVVKEVINFTTMEQLHLTDDGQELYICLSFSIANKLGKNMKNQAQYTQKIAIAGVSLESLQFCPPYPTFDLKANEHFLSFSIGPISTETLTRVVFVHLNTCTKLFSLETGQELTSNHFPLRSDLPAFDPMLMALCPSQRVIAHAGPTDTRIETKIFIHANDGMESSEADDDVKSLLTTEVIKGLRSSVEKLKEYSVKTVLTTEVPPDFEYEEAKVEVDRFISYVWNAFEVALQRKKAYEERERVVINIYSNSTNLGVIRPVTWPPNYNKLERKARIAIKNRHPPSTDMGSAGTGTDMGIGHENLSMADTFYKEILDTKEKGLKNEYAGEDGDGKRTSMMKEYKIADADADAGTGTGTGSNAYDDGDAYIAKSRGKYVDWHILPPTGMVPYSEWDGQSHVVLDDPDYFDLSDHSFASRATTVQSVDSLLGKGGGDDFDGNLEDMATDTGTGHVPNLIATLNANANSNASPVLQTLSVSPNLNSSGQMSPNVIGTVGSAGGGEENTGVKVTTTTTAAAIGSVKLPSSTSLLPLPVDKDSDNKNQFISISQSQGEKSAVSSLAYVENIGTGTFIQALSPSSSPSPAPTSPKSAKHSILTASPRGASLLGKLVKTSTGADTGN